MTETATEIPTDLITPLGAYLRLREAGPSFLLESVERGRLGRYSFVGCGSRIVGFEEAETLGAPVVGYLGYDFVAKLEPTVPLPDEGPELPESRFVVVDTLVRFDHPRGIAEVIYGDPAELGERLEGPLPAAPAGGVAQGGPLTRYPDQAEHERACRPRQGVHPRRGRLPDRRRAARVTPHVGLGTSALPRAPPGQPVAVPIPARARRARARRLLAGDRREV